MTPSERMGDKWRTGEAKLHVWNQLEVNQLSDVNETSFDSFRLWSMVDF
jgi:hypothetical protein